jgi:carbon-monoxide dehydrogenase iron sulfur subunit
VKRIIADPTRCMACRACELACALAHAQVDDNDLVEVIFHQGVKPRIYIESAGGLAVPLQCRHCEDAPCLKVCPSGALWRGSEATPVMVNQEKCIGCAFCVQACPFGVIRLGTAQKAVIKCDLCVRRQAAGLEPACVAACPVAALSFEDVDESARRARAKAAVQAVAAGTT